MKFSKLFVFFLCIIFSGCYQTKIKKAYIDLKIGASKNEMDRLFHDFKFIKGQSILPYNNLSENVMRGTLWSDKSYEDIQPSKDIINKFTFDGNIKTYSYLIGTQSQWPDNKIIYYIAIFYDKNSDRVIGKAIMNTTISIERWDEKF